MQFVLEAIARTPYWVWALLAFLLFIGVRALRPSTASFTRLAILPIAFLIWGLSGFAISYGVKPLGIAVWVVAIGIGSGLGLLIGRSLGIRADRKHGLIQIPGGALTLVLILIIFATKYVLGVLAGTNPDIVADPLYMSVDVGVSGLLTGMFAGRIYALWQKYQAAPDENLAA